MNSPPSGMVSPGLGLPSERIGHTLPLVADVVTGAAAPVVAAAGVAIPTTGAAGVAAGAVLAADVDVGHVDVTVSVVGTGVGVARPTLVDVPTNTGKLTAVSWPVTAEMA